MATEVYTLYYNGSPRILFSTHKLARQALFLKHEELRKRSVHFYDESEDSFSFYFGWEEKGGTWKVGSTNVIKTEQELLKEIKI